MSAAVAAIFDIKDRLSADIRKTAAGWIGSKAGSRNGIGTVDSNGFIDVARAAGGALTNTVNICILQNDIASTVAAAAEEALDFEMRIPSEFTEIGLPVVTSSDTYITPTAAMQGDSVGLYRLTDGSWAWDTGGSGHGIVTRVDVSRGIIYCVVPEANRVK
jgi:hypothetical protein